MLEWENNLDGLFRGKKKRKINKMEKEREEKHPDLEYTTSLLPPINTKPTTHHLYASGMLAHMHLLHTETDPVSAGVQGVRMTARA